MRRRDRRMDAVAGGKETRSQEIYLRFAGSSDDSGIPVGPHDDVVVATSTGQTFSVADRIHRDSAGVQPFLGLGLPQMGYISCVRRGQAAVGGES